MKKEVESMKRDKERMSERQTELAMALKDLTDDYKLAKDENERLRERITTYERPSHKHANVSKLSIQPVS